MENDVARIIGETLHVPPGELSKHTRLADLVQDSMDIVELIAVLTSEYGLEMDPSQLVRMMTVGDVVRYVTGHARRGERRKGLKTF